MTQEFTPEVQEQLAKAVAALPAPPPGLNPQEAGLLQILDWASDVGYAGANAPHWQQVKHLEGLGLLETVEFDGEEGDKEIAVNLLPGGRYEHKRLVEKEIALLAVAADEAIETADAE